MKKPGLIVLIIALIAVSLVYTLIPKTFVVNKIIYTDVRSAGVLRCLHDNNKWQQWFPGKVNKGAFIYNNQQYQPEDKQYASQQVSILVNDKSYASIINVIPIGFDSSLLEWRCQFYAGNNPFKRIMQYQTAAKINSSMKTLLDSFIAFTKNVKNIYGFDIKYTTLTDTALVSLKTPTKQYPSTALIYSMIDTLKEYIHQQNATVHNFPMLNIKQQQDSSYTVTVGVPTNIPLKRTNSIESRRMIMIKDKTLITYVTGDTSLVKKALKATADYMSDYQLAPPVISFQQLVTDRREEKDSTKWVTRIFSPIM